MLRLGWLPCEGFVRDVHEHSQTHFTLPCPPALTEAAGGLTVTPEAGPYVFWSGVPRDLNPFSFSMRWEPRQTPFPPLAWHLAQQLHVALPPPPPQYSAMNSVLQLHWPGPLLSHLLPVP